MNIKIRLLQLGKKQVDLLEVLRKRGFEKLSPATLSRAINNRTIEPQAVRIREVVYEILTEWENEQEVK